MGDNLIGLALLYGRHGEDFGIRIVVHAKCRSLSHANTLFGINCQTNAKIDVSISRKGSAMVDFV